MKNKIICNNCNKKIQLGNHTGERRFWDNQWEFYSCGSVRFTPAEDWTNHKWTCGDCNDNSDTGLPVGSSCR